MATAWTDDQRTLITAAAIVLAAIILAFTLWSLLNESPQEACEKRGGTWRESTGKAIYGDSDQCPGDGRGVS